MDGEDFAIKFFFFLGICLVFGIGFFVGMGAEKQETQEAREFCQEFCLKYQPTKECLEKCGR